MVKLINDEVIDDIIDVYSPTFGLDSDDMNKQVEKDSR